MCDFHNFGLIFAGQMHCLPQRLKSTLFEIFSNGGCPKGTRSVEKISNNVDFSLWGNRATTWEYFLTFSSETKIMKIRHSVSGLDQIWRNGPENGTKEMSTWHFFSFLLLSIKANKPCFVGPFHVIMKTELNTQN